MKWMQALTLFLMKIPWLFIRKFWRGRLNFQETLISWIIFSTKGFIVFSRNAKSIVKHLLVADLSKRYGNLKNGKTSLFKITNLYQFFFVYAFVKVSTTLKTIVGSLTLIGMPSYKKKFLCPINLLWSKTFIINFFFQTTIFLRAANDTSNFSSYPESDHLSPALKPSEDPFLDW